MLPLSSRETVTGTPPTWSISAPRSRRFLAAKFSFLGAALPAGFALAFGRKLTPEIEERVIDGEVIEGPEQADPGRVGLLKLPFGPFLALAALEYLLAGDAILAWYFRLLQ